MASLIGSRPVSQQHPIPTVWMIVLGRAKTNSSSTRGPNKLADLKLQGHAQRSLPHPPPCPGEKWKGRVRQTGDGGGGRRRGIEFQTQRFALFFFSCLMRILTSLLLIAGVSGVPARLPPEITCQSNSGCLTGVVFLFLLALFFPLSYSGTVGGALCFPRSATAAAAAAAAKHQLLYLFQAHCSCRGWKCKMLGLLE